MANIDLRKKVRIHELLSEALSNFTLEEYDYEVMFYLLAKITKTHKDETVYLLNLKELDQLTGKEHNLTRFINSAKKLRSLTIVIEDSKKILIDGILSTAVFMKGKSTMEVSISKYMKPYLLELTQNYTEHQLYSIMRLKSKHAKKLYLYFNNHRPKKGVLRSIIEKQPIEKFKIELGYKNPETGEELQKKWNNFKNSVLDIAKEEINALTNIRIAYYTEKWGRETYWIEWHIENKNNTELIQLEQFNTNQITSDDKNLTENLQEVNDFVKLTKVYGLDDEQAKIALKRISRELLNEILAIIDDQVEKKKAEGKKITNMGGYSVKVFSSKGLDLTKKK